MTPRPTAAQRGYGWTHVQTRRRTARIVAAGRATCSRCSQPILPGQPWDLDHTDDRTAYAGPAHASCNRAAGARKGNRLRARVTRWTTSGTW